MGIAAELRKGNLCEVGHVEVFIFIWTRSANVLFNT